MSDLISRQAAIDGVKTLHDVAWKNWHEPTLSANVVLDMIRELPSVQPDKDLIHLQKEQAYMQGYEDGQKPRRGKWIEGRDERFVKCSECGMESTKNALMGIALFGEKEPHFCPSCGADMRGEQEKSKEDFIALCRGDSDDN